MDLQTLCETLAQDDLVTVFQQADDEFDADRANVALELDAFAEPLALQITLVETAPDAIEAAELVQLYAPIPLALEPGAVATVQELLPRVNELVPLIGFNLHAEERFVYFRHVMLVPLQAPLAQQLVKEAVWLIYFALDAFAAQFVNPTLS